MHQLVLHPSARDPNSSVTKLEVFAEALLHGRILHLNYRIECPEGAAKVVWGRNKVAPVVTGEFRQDELWKRTCLEAFLLLPDNTYFEINLAPDGHWNCYHFDSYRSGMKTDSRVSELLEFRSSEQEHETPELEFNSLQIFELSVKVRLSKEVVPHQNFRLGLTTVIETEGGERSYWSLKHAADKPDFHDSRGHILEMRIEE